MKKLVIILFTIMFTVVAQSAWSQVKGDFSDWNVPPPLLPGSITKGVVNNKVIIIPPLSDVPFPGMPAIKEVQLSKLAPVLTIAPEVAAPDQPEISGLTIELAAIPLPAIPDALGLPKEVPQDDPMQSVFNMPVPAVPEITDLPKTTDGQPDVSPGKSLPIPITPELFKQPVPEISVSNPFPFTEWIVPSIPSNIHLIIIAPYSEPDLKSPPKTKPKVKKSTQPKPKH